jgi:hypothetical protein
MLALADLVALDDVIRIDLTAGLGIDLAVLDAVAGLSVELMEGDLLALGGRGEQRDRAGDEGELQIAFSIRTWGHGPLPSDTRHEAQRPGKRACSVRDGTFARVAHLFTAGERTNLATETIRRGMPWP